MTCFSLRPDFIRFTPFFAFSLQVIHKATMICMIDYTLSFGIEFTQGYLSL